MTGRTFLTVEEAARLFKVSTKTIRRRVTSGEWPHVRIGRQIRIELEAIAGRSGPASPTAS